MKTYNGDVGTELTFACGHDISAASALAVEARKPDGSIVTWTGTLQGTQEIVYTVAAPLEAGDWYLQPKVTIGAGIWYGETARLKVYARFA